MQIPNYLKNKPIPQNNINPLQTLAQQENIQTIGQLTFDLLKKYYRLDPNFFWQIIKQLGFMGVQFDNQLAKYNIKIDIDNIILLNINPRQRKEPLDYNLPVLNTLKSILLSYGMFLKGDLNDIPLESFFCLCMNIETLKNDFEAEGFDFKTFNLSLSNLPLFKTLKIRDQGYYCLNNLRVTVPVCFNDYKIKIDDFLNCPKLIEHLFHDDIMYIGDIPADLLHLLKYKSIGNETVNKFSNSINNLIEKSAPIKISKQIEDKLDNEEVNLKVRNTGFCYFNNKKIYITEKLYLCKIDKSHFKSCQRLIENLESSNICYIGDLPTDLSLLQGFIGIGKTAIEKFLIYLDAFSNDPKFEKGTFKYKILKSKSGDVFLPQELFGLPINEMNFPNCYNEIKYLRNMNINVLDDLPNDLIKFEKDIDIKSFINNLNEHILKIQKELFNEYKELFSILRCLINSILNNEPILILKEHTLNIFKERILPNEYGRKLTLENIGNRYNLTKERIRQICKKASIKIIRQHKRFFELTKFNLLSGNGLLSTEFLFGSLTYNQKCILQFLLNEYDIFFDIENNFIHTLGKEIDNLFIKYCNFLKDKLPMFDIDEAELNNAIENFLINENISKECHETFKNYSFNNFLFSSSHGYYFKDLTKADMLCLVFAEYFPEGLMLYKDYKIFENKIKETFPGIFEKDSKRSIIANLLRDGRGVYLWGWGLYIHQKNIKTRLEDIETVVNWIKEYFNQGINQISVFKPFSKFKTYLLSKSVVNEYALYTCIRLYFTNDFYLSKAPWIFPLDNKGRSTNVQLFEEYLFEANRRLSYNELKNEFVEKRGWKEFMLFQVMSNSAKLIRTDYNKYFHIDLLNIDHDSLLPFELIIKNKLAKENIISVRKIFNDKKASCIKIGIDSEFLLYYLLKIYFIDEFSFPKYPHICQIGLETENEINNRVLVENFVLESKGTVFRTELKDKFEISLGWNRNSLDNGISLSPLIVPIKKGQEYVHRKIIGWSTENQNKLEEQIISLLDEYASNDIHFISLSKLIYSFFINKLPKLANGINWTEDILAFFIDEIPSLILLGTKKLVLMLNPNAINVEDEIDFVEYILRTKFSGATQLKELEKELETIDLISSYFPKSYYNEDENLPYIIQNNEIFLRELKETEC